GTRRADCKLLLFLLQQFAFSLDPPTITAEPAVLLDDAVARDYETDVVGRTGARDGANGPGRTNRFGDFAVGACLPVRNRLEIPPHFPLKSGGRDVERQIERSHAAVQVRDERPHPLRERAALTLNRRRRILGAQILLELLVSSAEFHGTQSFLGS